MVNRQEIPCLIVGVGASAGGLEALERFFSGLPNDTGMSFVVIQHLSPDHKSMMVELLSKKTDLKVHQIEENMPILPNCIYLIPPRHNVVLKKSNLHLQKSDHKNGINRPIDLFFSSLAKEAGDKAVAIVLSGTGSDGMRGFRDIKEAGGLLMVQSSDSAAFDGMPESAISTGLVDFIQKPEELQEQLVYYNTQPRDKLVINQVDLTQDQSVLKKIFQSVYLKTQLDFSQYKFATVVRRIERRLVINQLDTLDQYYSLIKENPREIYLLYKEILIGVTSFFRDPQVFEYLSESLFPEILKADRKTDFRVWVAGCSTGEEAYTLAIIINEFLDKENRRIPIKIFATDVDSDAINKAGTGFYPEGIAADLPPEILGKYFTSKDEGFQINRNIRQMVVFAQHNLIADPPFTNIDFISCRNMLIYFQPQLQLKVIKLFNFSLCKKGILMLGMSETTGEMASCFKKENSQFKIFRSLGKTADFNKSPLGFSPSSGIQYTGTVSQGKRYAKDSEKFLEQTLLGMAGLFFTTALIVNDNREILFSCGKTEDFFKLPIGKTVNDIGKMAIKELSMPITMGLQRLFRTGSEQHMTNLSISSKESKRIVWIRLLPLPESTGSTHQAALFLGERENESQDRDVEEVDGSHISPRQFEEMERELNYTRENLQATIEELETSNEELQATNEELLASNEELQSTNEELQSTNEELHTVNTEYQSRIIELTELNNDVENLLASTQIFHMILDENAIIRKFSQGIDLFFSVVESDIGRPLTHFGNHLADLNIPEIIEKVQDKKEAIEKEFYHKNGKIYLLKAYPYLIGPKEFAGVILSFIDITSLFKAEQSLENYKEMYTVLFQSLGMGIVFQDQEGQIIDANPAAEELLGVSRENLLDRSSETPDWKAIKPDGSPFPGSEHPAIMSLKKGKKIKNVIMGIFHPVRNETVWIKIHAYPIFENNSDTATAVYSIFDELTEKETPISL